MKRMAIVPVSVALIVLLSVISVSADDGDMTIYYVNLDYNPDGMLCEDGSRECPFNTVDKAIDKGYENVCESRQFAIYLWNGEDFGRYRMYWGRKPVPGMGLPLARVAQIVLIALAGLVLLILALRLQRRRAT